MSPRTGGLLAVHAHPDDETLSNGALLATWVAAGRPVTVLTCTRGEQGEVIGPELAHLEGDGPALAAHRERELAGALRALGVRDHAFLDRVPLPDDVGPVGPYRDSGMAWAGTGRATGTATLPDGAFVAVPLDEAAARVAAVIRDRRPDVVVGYEPGGGYGHPDHLRAHDVLRRAVGLVADTVSPVVLQTVIDEDDLRAAYARLAADPPSGGGTAVTTLTTLTAPDPRGDLPSCAVAPVAIDLTVDVVPVLERVVAALRAHATQVQAVEVDVGSDDVVVGRYALSNRVLTPLLRREAYRFAPLGPAGAPAGGWPPGIGPAVP